MYEFTSEDRDRVLRTGPIIRMRIDEKRGRKEVGATIFKAGTMIDTTYFDKAEIADASRSDMPLMQAMMRAGFVTEPECEQYADHLLFTWRLTDKGAEAARGLSREAGERAMSPSTAPSQVCR